MSAFHPNLPSAFDPLRTLDRRQHHQLSLVQPAPTAFEPPADVPVPTP
jgi:hypothetical protein